MVMSSVLSFMLAATPALTAPTIRDMVEVTDLSSVAVSPDGRQVVFRAETPSVDRNTYDYVWYVVPSDGRSAPRHIADAGEGEWPNGSQRSEPPIWTADSTAIVYRAIRDGEIQVWRTAIDGTGSQELTSDPANVTSFTLSRDSRTLTFAVGATREAIERAEQAEYKQGVLIDAKVDPLRPLYRGSRIAGRLATDRLHGFWGTIAGLLADQPLTYRTVDLESGTVRDATPAEIARITRPSQPFEKLGDRDIRTRVPSGDGRGVAYVLGDGAGSQLMVQRPGSKTHPIVCDAPLCRQRINNIAWQGRADGILFVTTDIAAEQTLYLWNLATGKVRRIGGGVGRFNGGRDESKGCAVSADAAFCVGASADVPPHLVRFDLRTGRTQILAAPNEVLDRPQLLQFKPMIWVAPNGQRYTGKLMMPAMPHRPLPLFVTYYVCDGYLRGGTGDEFPLRQLAQAGIAALCINRLPTAMGEGDQIAEYRAAQAGVESAIDLLAGEGLIDPKRVGMGGMSFGGEVTMWVATHSSRLAVMSVGSMLLSETYYWLNAIKGREVPDVLQRVWNIGNPDTDQEHWKNLAPPQMVDAIHAPLLMQMPEREFRANVELAARLGRADKPVELFAFPEETHVKYQPRHKFVIYQRNLDWFRFWLQDYVDPDPAKADQYRRWDAMKTADQSERPATPRAQASASTIGSNK